MPSKVIVMGMVIVITTAILVFIVEFFVPLSMKSDMNFYCRNTLLKMEAGGGLTGQERLDLEIALSGEGFTNIYITGTDNSRQGEMLNLHVDADYSYSKLTALFSRTNVIQHMSYSMTTMSRKVVN